MLYLFPQGKLSSIKLSRTYFSGKYHEDWLHAEESLKEGIHFYAKVSLGSNRLLLFLFLSLFFFFRPFNVTLVQTSNIDLFIYFLFIYLSFIYLTLIIHG